MDRVTVKVIKSDAYPLPTYETPGAAGMDVCAVIDREIVIPPMGRALVPTGLRMEMPAGYECQIRPRSGLALNRGITVLNTPGTVDADSRAEIGAILINLSDKPFTVRPGDRICQMVFKKCVRVEWEEVKELDKTKREDGAFGESGLKPEPGK